jgi:adenosylcobinamide-phosphate synthase
MSFLAILLALIAEQARPLARSSPVHSGLRGWSRNMLKQFDAGDPQHGWLAWSLAVALPAIAAWLVHWLLWQANPVLAFAWHALVLYVTLGFRQFSHHFTDIRDALDAGDEPRARKALAHWRQVDTSELPKTELLRHVIEYSALAAHRHVFGVLAWYTVLSALGFGPAGAVLYRMAEFVVRYWVYLGSPGAGRMSGSREHHGLASPAAQAAAAKAWQVIDYVPSRITALAFAVVGSFEDAVDSWRNYANSAAASTAANDNDAVIIAATAGALNVRLGGEALRTAPSLDAGYSAEAGDADLGDLPTTPGREPEFAHLAQVVGLVWRSVVLWMVLLALLTLARLLG